MLLDRFRSKSKLDEAIDEVLVDMNSVTSDTPEYAKMVKRLKTLHALRQAEKPKPVDWNTVVLTCGNIAGICVIVKYEQFNVITSKAMNFLQKLK